MDRHEIVQSYTVEESSLRSVSRMTHEESELVKEHRRTCALKTTGLPDIQIDELGWIDKGLAALPTVPQSVVDGVAGFGDIASFGATSTIRSEYGIANVNYDSAGYGIGKIAGLGASIYSLAGLGIATNVGLRAVAGANLYHFTTAAAAEQIATSGVICGSARGLYGAGVYATAFNSRLWALISGARSAETAVPIANAVALATPFPGTFRVLGNVLLK